jgi:hypothetical protein
VQQLLYGLASSRIGFKAGATNAAAAAAVKKRIGGVE